MDQNNCGDHFGHNLFWFTSWSFSPTAATVLNSVQPPLQTSTQAVFQPPAGSLQPVQSALQQPCIGLTSQSTPAAIISAAQEAVAQATPPSAVLCQSNISAAALQTAGLAINPALVRNLKPRFTDNYCASLYFSVVHSKHPVLLLRSMLHRWERRPSFWVPSPPVPLSPMPCPTWQASPARSWPPHRDRLVWI